jgi:hypothetical protein
MFFIAVGLDHLDQVGITASLDNQNSPSSAER